MLRKQPTRAAALATIMLLPGLLAGVPLLGDAAAAPTPKYSRYTTVGPSGLIEVDTSQVIEVTITNVSTKATRLGSARFTLPESFLDASVPPIIYSSKGKKWTASISESVVSVAAKGGGTLGKLQSITVPLTATPDEVGGFQLAITAWRNPKFRDTDPMMEHYGYDAAVAVGEEIPGDAVVVSCGLDPCDTEDSDPLTGVDSAPMPQSDVYQVYAEDGDEPSVITAYVDYTPLGDPLRMSCQNVDQVLVFDVTGNRAKVVTDERTDWANLDFCLGAPYPWQDGSGDYQTYNPATGLFEGQVSGCTENPYGYLEGGNSPCIEAFFVDVDTVLYELYAPPGDPRITN
ncbi:hypothetical protein F0U44_16165 [Nocardioides humilatus]|uniref:Uncharacterized protein n=1 Tax=Nocardioides humilatus TaxID=2607660 RepID=A0A5B1LC53_9ACTN|nr:hypothetical protein [Nocardioides humilatus]KAA1417818.1 hypothetical protein F0U44_16165 [Nocardioides humilatus]